MDVYLSLEAENNFKALQEISSDLICDGLLIGHKRGHRYLIEKIFPTMENFFPNVEKYYSLNQMFKDRIVGFYSFKGNDKKLKIILSPFAYGKLYIEVELNKEKRINFKPYLIDFRKNFYLSPITLAPKKEGYHGKPIE